MVVEGPACRRQQRDADQVGRDRGHVGLDPRGPVHLDVRRPGRLTVVASQAVPPQRCGWRVQSEAAAHRGVQAVGGHDEAEPAAVHLDTVAVLTELAGTATLDLDPGRLDGGTHRRMQRGTAYATAEPAPERRLHCPLTREVADAEQVLPGRIDAEVGEGVDSARHQALAARLVDGAGTLVPHADAETRPGGVQGGRQSGGPSAHDQEVVHRVTRAHDGSTSAPPRAVNARVSTRRRTARSRALQMVNTTAVIHAEPTSGSAKPSTTTAT